jgi:hypothetical protein
MDVVDEHEKYDAVVMIGVLEWVGGGMSDEQPYLRVLREAHDCLRDGGSVIIAIENRLGVRYLCGSPEDHSGVAWQSVEGYEVAGPAYTFTRGMLERLLLEAGFVKTHFMGCFPDYRMCQVAIDCGAMRKFRSLSAELPVFPSPEWRWARVGGPSESLLWRSLALEGIGEYFVNSFLVVGRKAGDGIDYWPDERFAMCFDTSWGLGGGLYGYSGATAISVEDAASG